MTKVLLVVSVVMFMVVPALGVEVQEEKTIEELCEENALLRKAIAAWRAQNEKLRQAITAWREQNEKLKQEIVRLKAGGSVSPKLNPAVAVPSGATKVKYMYLGKQRTKAWFDKMYEKFADKISVVDGKYYDIGEDILRMRWVWKKPPEIGGLRCSGEMGKIVQSIADHEARVESRLWGTPETVRYYVSGISKDKNIADNKFEVLLVYTGPYRYVTTMGASQAIQGYAVYRPLTKEQFQEAIASGITLVEYKAVTKTVAEKGVSGAGFSVQPVTRMVTKTEITGTPVR